MLLNCRVGKDSWESLGLQEIQLVHPKGNQSWVFIGRTDVEAETPILWPPDVKTWFIGKDPDAGKAWGQEEKGMTEDEMARWHHRLNGHGFGWTPGVGGSEVKASACNVVDLGSIPGLGRSPGEGNGNSLQYSCLVNSMDGGPWWATVHGVTKSQTRLSNFTSLHFFRALVMDREAWHAAVLRVAKSRTRLRDWTELNYAEDNDRKKKDRTTHSSFSFQSLLISKPNKMLVVCVYQDFSGGTSGKEPTCQYSRLKRHGFNPWVRKILWKRKWQPTLLFLTGESHGQKSLGGYSHKVTKSQTWLKWLSTHTCVYQEIKQIQLS